MSQVVSATLDVSDLLPAARAARHALAADRTRLTREALALRMWADGNVYLTPRASPLLKVLSREPAHHDVDSEEAA